MTQHTRSSSSYRRATRSARVVAALAAGWLVAAPVHAQVDLLSHAPEILVVDAVIEYAGAPGAAPFAASAMALVPRLRGFWAMPIERASEKGHVVAAATLDAFGNVGDIAVVAPSTVAAINAAAVDALGRLKQLPAALAAYPPNRQRLVVTFYYNDASTPGPVDPPVGWPPVGAFRVTDGATLPRLLREVKPHYTSLAMQAMIQGKVMLECVVQADGSVGATIVLRSLDRTFGLDHEAVVAARQWQFEPGTRLGRPVDVLVTIELSFTLK
jgi:TonB family protein